MAGATRICKVCGKEYEYCYTVRRTSDIFRWQDVACCPEHGSTYFAKVEASRSAKLTDEPKSEPESEIVEEVVEDIDEFDEDEDDELEDEEEDEEYDDDEDEE